MSDSEQKTGATPSKKPRQGRSPGYPFVSLRKALDRAESFRVAEGGRPKHFSPRAAIARAWEMGEKTGPTKQTIAALGHFGLFEFQGSGENRGSRLTDLAFGILLDKRPESAERDELIRKAALLPSIHAELWKEWQGSLPSDPTLETYLMRDRGFSESGARDLIAEYKDTLAFAKLLEPGNIPLEEEGSDGDKGDNNNDRVPPPSPLHRKPKVDMMAGERELTTGLLSKEASFRLIVNGKVGVKEIERLIRKLEFDKEILADMEGEEQAL